MSEIDNRGCSFIRHLSIGSFQLTKTSSMFAWEKYPIRFFSFDMWFQYQIRYQPKVQANVGFCFGIGPKSK